MDLKTLFIGYVTILLWIFVAGLVLLVVGSVLSWLLMLPLRLFGFIVDIPKKVRQLLAWMWSIAMHPLVFFLLLPIIIPLWLVVIMPIYLIWGKDCRYCEGQGSYEGFTSGKYAERTRTGETIRCKQCPVFPGRVMSKD